jgi:hypothetical protein
MSYNIQKIMGLLEPFGKNEELSYILKGFYSNRDVLLSERGMGNTDLISEMSRIFQNSNGVGRRFNLVPCDNCPEYCRELLVAFAELGFESKYTNRKYGFRSLMARLYPHWFTCNDNNLNVIFTSNFDRKKFDEFYLPTFEAFKEIRKKIIVIEVAKDDLYIQYEN